MFHGVPFRFTRGSRSSRQTNPTPSAGKLCSSLEGSYAVFTKRIAAEFMQ